MCRPWKKNMAFSFLFYFGFVYLVSPEVIKHRERCFWQCPDGMLGQWGKKQISTTYRMWRARKHISICSCRIYYSKDTLLLSCSLTHRKPDYLNSAGGIWQCGRRAGSVVCIHDCLSHFILCLLNLSAWGARSRGVTALICHADRLGNKEEKKQDNCIVALFWVFALSVCNFDTASCVKC